MEYYVEFKDAIDEYFYEERRWAKKGKLNSIAESAQQEQPETNSKPAGDETNPEDWNSWMSNLMGEIIALVKGKLGKAKGKGKRKNKGDKQGDGDVEMGTANEPIRYECGEKVSACNHYARDCPVRKARVAVGGPAILKGDEGGKGDKGKAGNGGKGGKGGWPTQQQWRGWFPGPTPTQWQGWYPQPPGKGTGKANLFETSNSLSAMQALFTPGLGGMYSRNRQDLHGKLRGSSSGGPPGDPAEL